MKKISQNPLKFLNQNTNKHILILAILMVSMLVSCQKDEVEVTTVSKIHIPSTGLIAYWNFSGNANDASGNKHDGLVKGATLTTDRYNKTNSAYQFNGQNNYIEIPLLSAINNKTNLTISYWANTNLGFTTGTGSIFSHWVDNGNSQSPIGFQTAIANNGKVGVSFVGGLDAISSSLIGINTWKHVVIIFDGSQNNANKIKLYINGDFIENITHPNYNFNALGSLGNKTFIGASAGTQQSPYNYFSGKIDDIAIWDRALTLEEILGIYYGCN